MELGGVERHSCCRESGRPDGQQLRSGGVIFLSEVGVLQRDSEEDQRSCGQVKAPP